MSDPSTRDRILDVAEKLFSDKGFDATSLRMITAHAKVNLAAVHYHFGSKEELLHATLRRRIAPVNEERLRRLDAAIAAADGATPPVEAIVDAFVRPAIEALSGVDHRQLMGMIRMMHTRSVDRCFIGEVFGDVIERFSIIADAAPHLSPAEASWRFRFMVGSMLHSVGDRFAESANVPDSMIARDPRAVADAVRAWASAGFHAPAAWPLDSEHAAGVPRFTQPNDQETTS